MLWRSDSLAATAANEAALLVLVADTPELEDIADLLARDRDAIGSRAPYFRAETPHGHVILKLNLSPTR